MSRITELAGCIPEAMAGRRLDQALAAMFPDFSRSRLQQWIKAGEVQIDGRAWSPKDKVSGGESVTIAGTLPEETACAAEPIPLEVIFQDEDILVVNKPAGLVVHPAAGNPDGTMQNALLHLDPNLSGLPRSGIIHRLDKMTTGLLVVARTLRAHTHLVDQLQARRFVREYDAIVHGVMTAGGTVEAPIARHPVDRKRQAVVEGGKPAITHYRVAERFRAHSYIKVRLETGRTHQIRVHMAYVQYPLVGDPVYGGRLRVPRGASPRLREMLQHFRRQALHAGRLGLQHPVTGEPLEWQAPVPEDMQELLDVLRQDRDAG